jgi:taurine dioxygenase
MQVSDIKIEPIRPVGALITGIDLREEIPQAVKQALNRAFNEHALLLFRDQQLEKPDLLRIASTFGPVSDQGEAPGGFNYVSNMNPAGLNAMGEHTLGGGDGELEFHFDHCFEKNVLKGILLYSVEIPPTGGDTLFSDVRLATRQLPAAIRERIDGLTIRHKAKYRTGRPEASHPIMFTHPRTGEKVLFFSKLQAQEINGMSPEESAELLQQFPSYIERKEIIYRHVWRPRDVVVWDNLALQHARENFDPRHKRHLQRVQIG